MRDIGRQEKEVALADGDVAEYLRGGGDTNVVCRRWFGGCGEGGVDCAEEHGAFVLVEELGGGVYVLV